MCRLYRPKFSFGIVIEANTEKDARQILEDRMRKEPSSFISALEQVEPLQAEKGFLRRLMTDR